MHEELGLGKARIAIHTECLLGHFAVCAALLHDHNPNPNRHAGDLNALTAAVALTAASR